VEAAAEEGAAAAEAEVLAVVGAVALVLPAVARAVVTEPVVLVAVRAAAVPLVLAAPVSAREVMLAASVELRPALRYPAVRRRRRRDNPFRARQRPSRRARP
jgi:hypothetical protein